MKQLISALIFGLCAFVALSGASQQTGGTPVLERAAQELLQCVHIR